MDEPSALTQPEPVRVRSRPGTLVYLLALAVVLLFALGVWQWYEGRQQANMLREETARQLRTSSTDSRDARRIAQQARETVRELQAKLMQLEAKVDESRNQQVALESLYQELSRNRDEWVLAEVEQILSIAVQQLKLAGSVPAALAALQTADSRLARSDLPQFFPLRKVIERDIERLKETPAVDIPGLALKLDQAVARVDTLPLGPVERKAAERRPVAVRGGESFWRRLGADIWGELKTLVQVTKLDHSEPPLLTPTQGYFLRENLKLRLLNARIALLSRDQKVFRADLKLASTWIRRYFDVRSRPVVALLANLKTLAASGIHIHLPNISDSLAAVRNYKLSQEKARQ